MHKVSLLGYPNAGKTSIFNALTNLNKKTGNFAGVTVSVASATANINNMPIQLSDLPGINSLTSFANSKDELVVGKYIQDNPNNLYISVVNIAQINKHLILTLSALAKNLNVMLAVNMVDTVTISKTQLAELKRKLSTQLGIDVVFVSAKTKNGMQELTNAIQQNLTNPKPIAQNKFTNNIATNTLLVNKITKGLSFNIKASYLTNKIDKILLNSYLSIPLFFGVIYLILLATMNIHGIFSGLIDSVAGLYFVDLPKQLLGYINAPDIVTIILADGIGGGIQTMLTFAPIIFTLFVLLGLLEDTGYSARQAFIADEMLQKIGLPGKAFVSLTLGLGCTAACSSGCRTLERESDRRLTLMISPSISCSAKLPVYIYFCFIVFTAHSTLMVFLMYAIGIVFAVLNGLYLSKSLFTNNSLPFVVELPNYRLPNFTAVAKNSAQKVKGFLKNLGKMIVPIIALLTVLNSVSFRGKIVENPNQSILAQTSSVLTPLFIPMGIKTENWQATLSLITGFLAKEVVVATLNSVYFPTKQEANAPTSLNLIPQTLQMFAQFGNSIFNKNYNDVFDYNGAVNSTLSDDINAKRQVLLQKFAGTTGVFAFLLFFVIYTPCVSAMGAISQEIGKAWAWLVGSWSVFNAFSIATLYYQFTLSLLHGLVATLIFTTIYTVIFIIFKNLNAKYGKQWESNFVFGKKTNGL